MAVVVGYDIDELGRDFRVNGFAVFDEFIAHEKIYHILQCWAPVRDADIEKQGEFPVRGRLRYNVRVPFRTPLVDEEVFEHRALVAFLEAELGEEYVFSHFDSNVPLKQWLPEVASRRSRQPLSRHPHASPRHRRQVSAVRHERREREL